MKGLCSLDCTTRSTSSNRIYFFLNMSYWMQLGAWLHDSFLCWMMAHRFVGLSSTDSHCISFKRAAGNILEPFRNIMNIGFKFFGYCYRECLEMFYLGQLRNKLLWRPGSVISHCRAPQKRATIQTQETHSVFRCLLMMDFCSEEHLYSSGSLWSHVLTLPAKWMPLLAALQVSLPESSKHWYSHKTVTQHLKATLKCSLYIYVV